ncbi:MAG: glycosyltransferase family 4 protein [Bacteroidales bacterium]|nr:glycosyltransferase family 4 protein [Bacteroidales bacterium]MCM1414557.1 glycosyltransferase family 4 protein [bacterium]MCM1422607.1 glycosyltransferase family 4 protein [bacterium]
MKVLMVNKFLHPNGGSETYIFQLGEELQRKGHEVQYFGMEHAGRAVGNRAQCYTADLDFHTGKLTKLLYPFRILYSFEAKRKLDRVLCDMEPDVVHLNNINFQLTPSVIYAVRAYRRKTGRNVKLVYTAHDYQWVCPNHMMRIPADGKICFACREGHFFSCVKNRCIHGSFVKSLLGALEGAVYHRLRTYGLVDAIVCPSAFMKRQLDTDPILADKTVMMHNFVERPDTGAEREGTEIEDHAVRESEEASGYVLYFGRFSEEKGIATLLKACRALPEIPFVFAGTGPLEALVAQAENVENRGYLAGDALRKLIADARFSVYPSEWYENCPFSVMESQMYGTPVLVSDLGGAPELVQAGSTGELFRGGDAEELAQHIKELWEDPERCRRYREACRSLNFYTVGEYCDKIVNEVYV